MTAIAGYASLFGVRDLGGDVVARGAFRQSLARRSAGRLGMLHQHVTADPIGVWDVAREDTTGLFVRGRIIVHSPAATLAAARAAGRDPGRPVHRFCRPRHPARPHRPGPHPDRDRPLRSLAGQLSHAARRPADRHSSAFGRSRRRLNDPPLPNPKDIP